MEKKIKNLELICYGYIRRNNDKHVPAAIVEIIIQYCELFFKFIENENSVFAISNNGYSAELTKFKHGTIQFGDFFTLRDDVIYTVTFKMETCLSDYSGIGFITSDFKDWDHGHTYDESTDNDSMYWYGNGYFKTSKVFDPELKNTRQFLNGGLRYDYPDYSDEVCVKIDTQTKHAIIWNNKIDLNKLNVDDMGCVLSTTLPISENVHIAIMVDMGHKQQKITVIDQKFEYYT